MKFATFALVDDIETGLTNGESAIAKTSGQDLLMWARRNGKTTAAEYEAAYDDNEISADNLYKGKQILVSGTVARIEKAFTGGGNIWLTGSGLLGVHAALDSQGTAAAASFNRGRTVNLVCVGAGRLLTVVTLNNCEPLSSYLAGTSPWIESRIEDFLEGRRQLPGTSAQMVAFAYVTGLFLPASSPCMNGNREECSAEMDRLANNKTTTQAIRTKAQSMLASLKVK